MDACDLASANHERRARSPVVMFHVRDARDARLRPERKEEAARTTTDRPSALSARCASPVLIAMSIAIAILDPFGVPCVLGPDTPRSRQTKCPSVSIA